MAWQTIDTAPKDGTAIMVGDHNGRWIAMWHKSNHGIEGWYSWRWYSETPTHWMPLPDPPIADPDGRPQ